MDVSGFKFLVEFLSEVKRNIRKRSHGYLLVIYSYVKTPRSTFGVKSERVGVTVNPRRLSTSISC